MMNRRHLLNRLAGAGLGSAMMIGTGSASANAGYFAPPAGPRCRVLYLNDLAGDIDGLFATVHFLLSPSVDLRAIVGTCGDMGGSARDAKNLADEIVQVAGFKGRIATFEGADHKLERPGSPLDSPGSRAIIAEAMRTDTALPLFVAVGGGLTEVASALLIEPKIAGRFRLVWIGGGARHPEWARLEPNFGIDPLAAQHIYNKTDVEIWQVPSEVYQTCVVSNSELNAYVRPCGAIGAWLYDKLMQTVTAYSKTPFNPGATWSLGDNPLISLTALNDWVPSHRESENGPFQYLRTGSSHFTTMTAPELDDEGRAIARQSGRLIRLYRDIDTRLMLGDFFAKLRERSAQ